MPRGNPQNLIVPTSKQAQENGRKGGIASQKARKKRKTMKQLCEFIGSSQNNSAKAKQIAKQLGLDLDEVTFDFMALFMQYQKAINEKDTRAIEFIRDTVGEKPTNQVQVTNDYEDLTPIADLMKIKEQDTNNDDN